MTDRPPLEIAYFDAGGLLYKRDNDAARDELNEYLVREFEMRAPPLETYRQVTSFLRDELYSAKILPEDWATSFLQGLGLTPTPEQAKAFVDFYVANKGHFLTQTEGAREALGFLKDRGVRVWVITDTMHPKAVKQAWLDGIGVGDLVDEIVCSADVGLSKKDKRIFELAMERSGVPRERSVFIGHSTHEIRSSVKAELVTVSLEQGLGEDHYIPSLTELPALLERLFGL